MIFIDYKKLRNSGTKVIGVWDDHDYGYNDGDRFFRDKRMMRNLYLDFVDEPKESARYN